MVVSMRRGDDLGRLRLRWLQVVVTLSAVMDHTTTSRAPCGAPSSSSCVNVLLVRFDVELQVVLIFLVPSSGRLGFIDASSSNRRATLRRSLLVRRRGGAVHGSLLPPVAD